MTLFPRPAPRVYIDAGRDVWSNGVGTDYIISWGSAAAYTGWTATGTPTIIANAADGDLFSISDHNPIGIQIATVASAQSYRFQSLLFGARNHMKAAADILGYEPTLLCMRVQARFSVNSANEDQTGFGLVTTTAATTTNAQKVCWVSSDSANFKVRANTTTDTGAAIDTAWHDWLFVMDGTNIEWFIDGASQGTCAMQTDAYGAAFQVNGAAARTNVVQISNVHVWYQ